jgi:hypothetical protein
VQLKENRKSTQKKVLEAVKQGDINMFTVIKSHENHHAIIDEERDILGYRYHIKPELLRTLEETTAALPYNAGNRGNYPTCHYTVWCDYEMEPYKSAEYKKQLPASKE